MPQIKFVEVLSYSSECLTHPAENLLKSDSYFKWRCKEGTEDKQSWVTLKLEKLVSINAIDIGSDNSALIEVLVAREGVNFQVLLVASSFMTPIEARNGTNMNRVRIFVKEMLSKHTVSQKWDRIKVICTQPFARNVQYGLSFIKLHSSKDDSVNSEVKLGRFSLKEEEVNSNSISIGSFFSQRKEEKEKSPLRGAAAIRAASNDLVTRNKNMDGNVEEESNAPSLSFYQLKKSAKDDNNSTNPKNVGSPALSPKPSLKKDKDASKRPSEVTQPKTTSHHETTSKKNVVRKRKSRPFSRLMEDVTFVMSGYKNPLRSTLRDKMFEMGAKYKGDWDDASSTHLICAFTNTPKFNAVKGKGKIVSEKWIEECYRKKIRLPWRRYNLEKNRNADESEEEIYAEEILPKEVKSETSSRLIKDSKEEPGSVLQQQQQEPSSTESENTDDEIERIMKKGENKRTNSSDHSTPSKKTKPPLPEKRDLPSTGPNATPSDDETYDADTDVDEEAEEQVKVEKTDTSHLPLPPLGDYFEGKVFLLYGSMADVTKKTLCRYLIAHKGKVSNYMSNDVQYVVTEDTWDDKFDEALNENASMQFVKPQWIWRCCDKQKYVPPQPYLVVPS